MTAIRLQGVRKTFGETAAVDQVDLDIADGELFFLLGPSGCGKTTLLRILAGLTDPTAGAVFFDSTNVTDLAANKRNAALVFQGYALWPHLTVAQNVAFGLDVRKIASAEKKQRVADALGAVQMNCYAKRKPNELSGGQQQRVALARAMVVRPNVLLLDEPLSNLDAKLRIEMRSQIRAICKQAGITAVYVTHDQKEALAMADRIAVMRDGRVVQIGQPHELYRRPCNRFVADFLGQANFFHARIVERRADHLVIDSPFGRLVSTVSTDQPSLADEATCAIRPEAVHLLRDPEGIDAEAVNVLQARIDQTVYLGEIAQHRLLLAGDAILAAYELNPQGRSTDPSMRIRIDPDDVVILTD